MTMTAAQTNRLLTTLLLLLSGSAFAWTPYDGAPPIGYDPQWPPDAAAQGQPGMDGEQYPPMPPYPMAPGMPYGFPGAAGTPSPQVPPSGAPEAFGTLTLSPEITDEAYILIIGLNGRDPASVEVNAVGNALLITGRDSAQTSTNQQFDDGRGYQRSWSWSSGHRSRRLPAPPDADLSMLRREHGEDEVRIIIPRRQTPATDAQPQ